jgi:two-component system, LytTR family, response regulator
VSGAAMASRHATVFDPPSTERSAGRLRVALVDDEPLARERLHTLLTACPNVDIVAECETGEEAVLALASSAVDVLFLDVQMPGLDGFDVLEALGEMIGADSLPAIVFVTAFDSYALKAFEVSAVDYLLKPFDRSRFERALARAKARARRFAGPEAPNCEQQALMALLRALRADRKVCDDYAHRFAARSGNKLNLVRVEEVDWIDAAGNYARLHVGGRTHLVRETMTELESRLDPNRFVRVHRSIIVNVERVTTVEPYAHGEYVLTIRDGTRLTSSRTYSARLRTLWR